MNGFGGVLSICLKGGGLVVKWMFKKCYLFVFVELFGGVESFIEVLLIMMYVFILFKNRVCFGIIVGLVWFLVGVEDV